MGAEIRDQGEVVPLIMADLLAEARREQQRCRLTLSDGTGERSLWIDGTQVYLATSSRSEESLGQHLLRKRLISQMVLEEATERVLHEGKRLGRVLVEMGRLDYEGLWQGVRRHQREIALKILHAKTGFYRREPCSDQALPEENIPLQMEIGELLCEGLRGWMTGAELWRNRWAQVEALHIREGFHARTEGLKPHEVHVACLVKRLGSLSAVLATSELLEPDTCRVLSLLAWLDEVSDRPFSGAWPAADAAVPQGSSSGQKQGPLRCPFSSTEEALGRFNGCYEQIYRTLHKHLGPVAYTIMTRGIEEIRDNLPRALQHVVLDSLGRIDPALLSRSLFMGRVEEVLPQLMPGLEEILYAHVYAVKKHLGVDIETQVWRWMNGGE